MNCKCISLIIFLSALVSVYLWWSSCMFEYKHNFDHYRQDSWYGKELTKDQKQKNNLESLKPFRLNVSEEILTDLLQRLQKSRFINHLTLSRFHYGFNSKYLKQIQEKWINEFDWKTQERYINSFPQFTTYIEGIKIHFVHLKPKPSTTTVVPLLMIHGWPESFYLFLKTIPLLIEPDSSGLAFELIVPSLPGYGFSEAPHRMGFNAASAARIMLKLMKRLGHDRFFAHGGDWGHLVAKILATVYPENIRGVHLVGSFYTPSSCGDFIRMTLGYLFPRLYFGGTDYMRQWSKMFPLKEKFDFSLRESGYMHLQATKPDTIGSALIDSPIGLAAYILEKFSTWTDRNQIELDDGGLTSKFTTDELLTNVMIYWLSDNIASSQRFYLENLKNTVFLSDFMGIKIKVPVAILEGSKDLLTSPKKFIEPYHSDLVQYNEMDGGHFLAFERPKSASEDIRKFIKKVIDRESAKNRIHDEI
ncbi:propionyl-CoA carboxylase beta chain [Sarcoptes scabiei]|nr:propionyl-CoA carboxylase beta chain [Sarcoptes scabiei]